MLQPVNHDLSQLWTTNELALSSAPTFSHVLRRYRKVAACCWHFLILVNIPLHLTIQARSMTAHHTRNLGHRQFYFT